MMRSAVDLPQPEGPSRLRNSPWPMSSDMLWSATVPLEKTFDTLRRETNGVGDACRGLSAGRNAAVFKKGSVYRQEAGVDAISVTCIQRWPAEQNSAGRPLLSAALRPRRGSLSAPHFINSAPTFLQANLSVTTFL